LKNIIYDVGIYTRLSKDDNNGSLESMSIGNQKHILSDFVAEKGWHLSDVYVDDGFTGTNFDRPDFKRMIADIESGKINCVVTKDLSRLGRNYSMTGYYTDEYFPEKNVRYIAINDGVDTMGNNNDFAAFHNVINEYYPRDISRKVRQVKKANAAKGMFMGSHAPYGYMKSPQDKHVLIVDEDAALVVRRIFDEIDSGENGRSLAEKLNREGVLSPKAYWYSVRGRANPLDQSDTWGSATILNILRNEVYLGRLCQGKRENVSFKSKKKRVKDPSEWIVVEGTHEGIISQELWDSVHTRLDKDHPKSFASRVGRPKALFSGLVRCSDCGATMAASPRGRKGSEKIYYQCSRYMNNGKGTCSPHAIREDLLEEIVLSEIHSYAVLANEDKGKLIETLLTTMSDSIRSESLSATNQLARATQRIEEIHKAAKKLYDDNIGGRVPDSMLGGLMRSYDTELGELEASLPALRQAADKESSVESKAVQFTNMVSKYIAVNKLDRTLAYHLIDTISVSGYYQCDGRKTQDIRIAYKFVGDLSKLMYENEKRAISGQKPRYDAAS